MKNDPTAIFNTIVNSSQKKKRLGDKSYQIMCPCHDDKEPSLTVTQKRSTKDPRYETVVVHCHTGCDGKNIVNYFKDRGMWFDFTKTRPPAEPHSVIPAPEDKQPFDVVGANGNKPDKLWEYYTDAGALAFMVGRFDSPNGKKAVKPYSFVRPIGETSGGVWAWKLKVTSQERYPVYNLLEALSKPDATILVVEGEKACDAAKEYFPDMACVAYVGGAGNFRKSDWGFAVGRKVMLLPDNDSPGIKSFTSLAEYLLKQNCKPYLAFDEPLTTVPEKWDVADGAVENSGVLDLIAKAKAFEGAEDAELPPTKDRNEISERLSKRFKVVMNNGGKLMYVDIGSKAHGFDSSLPYALLANVNDLRIYHNQKFFDPGPPPKWLYEIDAYLQSEHVDIVSGIVYDPGTLDPVVEKEGVRKLNINCGYSVEPNDGELPKAFFAHLNSSMGRKEAEWFLDWVAHIVQHPKTKPGTTCILRGPQGSGKTVVGNIICAMIGRRHAYQGSFQANFLNNSYNGQASGKLFMQLDEMELGMTNRRHIEAAIKVATTDSTIHINEKYGLARTEDSYHRYLFTSNAQMPIPVYLDDRRLAVFNVVKTAIQEDLEFWPKLWAIITDKQQLGAMLNFFQKREITHDVKRPPVTEARGDMMGQSDTLMECIEEVLHGDVVPAELDRTKAGQGSDDWLRYDVMTSRHAFYKYYEGWLKNKGKDYDSRTRLALGKVIDPLFSFSKDPPKSARFVPHKDRVGDQTYVSRPLVWYKRDDMRERFEAICNTEIDWDDKTIASDEEEDNVIPFDG